MATYWGRVVYSGDIPPWELKEIPGKGLAAFATRRFEAGELICTETPTVWVPGHHPFSADQIAEIETRVASIDEADRDAFCAMANAFPEELSTAAGIFMTNCFDQTDSIHGESCAMYCALARLNHSCTPNAQQTHIPETGEEVLHASRCIELGEEINDCYIELRQSTARRRAALKDIYRFDCECPACGPMAPSAGARGDERQQDDQLRERAGCYDDMIISIASSSDGGASAALDVALEAVRLLTSPKCLPWSARYVADAHLTIYHIAESLGKRDLAYHHAVKAYEMNCRLQGTRAPVSISLGKKLRMRR